MKMKKLVALVTAAALCLGMSLTAFAADDKEVSPEELQVGWSEDGTLGVVTKELTEKEKADIAEAAKKALANQYNVTGKDVVVMGVGDYTLFDMTDPDNPKVITDGKVPNGGANFQFYLGSETKEGYVNGATIYVAHQKADGSWEIIEGKLSRVAGEWYVEVKMDSFSPVAFLKVMSNGKVVEVDRRGEPVKPATTRSPRTGE